MQKPIYFSKIEFIETIGHGNPNSIIVLNIPARELSYQVYDWKHQYPAKWISSGNTKFKPVPVKDASYQAKIIFSCGIKLTEQQLETLLPLCNALDYEPFRNRKMGIDEKSYCGYRDEAQVHFRGITDSPIPLLELPMHYYYDEEHIWPSERLYRYLIKNIFDKEKNMKGWYTPYGGFSLS